jgi:hypothetical protein
MGGLTPMWLGQPAARRMRRTEIRPIPSRRAISEWLNRSAVSRSASSALSDADRGRPWGRPSFLACAIPARTSSQWFSPRRDCRPDPARRRGPSRSDRMAHTGAVPPARLRNLRKSQTSPSVGIVGRDQRRSPSRLAANAPASPSKRVRRRRRSHRLDLAGRRLKWMVQSRSWGVTIAAEPPSPGGRIPSPCPPAFGAGEPKSRPGSRHDNAMDGPASPPSSSTASPIEGHGAPIPYPPACLAWLKVSQKSSSHHPRCHALSSRARRAHNRSGGAPAARRLVPAPPLLRLAGRSPMYGHDTDQVPPQTR